MGDRDHSIVQMALSDYLYSRRKDLGIDVLPHVRIRIRAELFRVADVCVVRTAACEEQVLTHPPFVCIEILSPEDRAGPMFKKVSEYTAFGIPYLWLVDPSTREAFVCAPGFAGAPPDRVLHTEDPDLALPLDKIFSELDCA